MTVGQLLYKARIRLGDPDKTSISDHSLLDALKSVLTVVAAALSNTPSNILLARADIVTTNGVGDLPADYQALVSVEDGWRHAPMTREPQEYEYQILGDKFYAEESTVSIVYKKSLQVSDTSDDVPLPNFFTELLLKYIKIILADGATQDDAELLSAISSDVYRLAAGRERTELRQKPIFHI